MNYFAQWVEVARVNYVPSGAVFPVEVAENSLILWRVGEEVKCYRNACTHLTYPIVMGKVNEGIITCPFHKFQYRLETGECLTAPDIPLESYPVKIEGEKVFVQLIVT